MRSQLFEIYLSIGAGLRPGPRFRHLEDALRYVDDHRLEASFAIKRPNGQWHVGDNGRRAIFRREPEGRIHG